MNEMQQLRNAVETILEFARSHGVDEVDITRAFACDLLYARYQDIGHQAVKAFQDGPEAFDNYDLFGIILHVVPTGSLEHGIDTHVRAR